MRPEHAVAHIDILGFKALIDEAEKDDSIYQTGKMIDAAIEASKKISPSTEFKSFSDNICCSMLLTDETGSHGNIWQFLLNVVAIQVELTIGFGHFVRGAISTGTHYQSDKTLISKPFTEAYLLESKQVISPRIVLTPKMMERFGLNKEGYEKGTVQGIMKLLILKDGSESYPFLNYLALIPLKYLIGFSEIGALHKELSTALEKHKSIIEKNLYSSREQNVISKMRWAATYHNYFASRLVGHAEKLLQVMPSTIPIGQAKEFTSIIQDINTDSFIIQKTGIAELP